jgi:hypothetical protein
MEPDTREVDPLEQLHAVLRRLVRRMTRREFSTPRLMQVDVGAALALLNRTEFPRKLIVKRHLTELLPEVGRRRPDLGRHVVALEEAVRELKELTEGG